MTLQQMEYIVAVDKYRHFVRAAEACGVTQSTLSSMIQKLETELDMQIFDRNSHPVRPTAQGENVIRQAQVILYNVAQMKEMVLSERMQESGELHLGVIPTIAPYIIPKLIRHMHSHYPHVQLRLLEARTAVLVEKLERAEIDVALLSTPLDNPKLLEIPLFQRGEQSEPGVSLRFGGTVFAGREEFLRLLRFSRPDQCVDPGKMCLFRPAPQVGILRFDLFEVEGRFEIAVLSQSYTFER